MVGCDIHQHRNICLKVKHAVKLKTTQLKNIPIIVARCSTIGKRLSNIASESYIVTCIAENFINERCGGCFAVTSRDTYSLRTLYVFSGKLHFGDYRNTYLFSCNNNWCAIRNTRRFDYRCGIKNLIFSVSSLLKFYTPLFKSMAINIRDFTHIGQKDIFAGLFSQNG